MKQYIDLLQQILKEAMSLRQYQTALKALQTLMKSNLENKTFSLDQLDDKALASLIAKYKCA